MHILVSILWLALAAAWGLAFAFLGHMAGGFKYISHVGWSVSAMMNLLISALSIFSAGMLLFSRKYPTGLAVVVALVTSIHLFNALGFFILTVTNGSARGLLIPFFLFAQVLPTNSSFIGMPVGNFPLLLLPLSSMLVLLLTLPFRETSTASRPTSNDS